MKILSPWRKEEDGYWVRSSISDPNGNKPGYEAASICYESDDDAWNWASFDDSNEFDLLGSASTLELAMQVCDKALIGQGWNLMNDDKLLSMI